MGRSVAILVALLAGVMLPGFSQWSWLIRWILCGMLFLGFLNMPLTDLRPQWVHLKLLVAWPLFMLAGWFGMLPFGRDAALAGLLVAATPTATAAPVITGFLGGNVGFVSISLLGSNLLGAVFLPIVLSALAHPGQIPSTMGFAASTFALVFAPLALAMLARLAARRTDRRIPSTKHIGFALWLGALVLVGAKTSAFLRGASDVPWGQILSIAVGSFALCAGQFLVGRRLGGVEFGLEAGQSLGQKNTTLTLWLGLAACGPIAALGPAFYVLWHNLWNGFQLGRVRTPS